eukprot:TRINITY_DN3883_c0_g1_i1.p1 TRINITY_DN3883_c0_g1~~TRINITY_DN3883_c0_g1_i1.p1  ORF type:complete len:317 (-),score=82.79 TRINITY_DN3883_c0_g1_i1:24-974(-)
MAEAESSSLRKTAFEPPVSHGSGLRNTSAQAAALAAGYPGAASAEPRLLDSVLLKAKGYAENVNSLAEDSVKAMSSLTDRMMHRVSPAMESAKGSAKEWTEVFNENIEKFGRRFEEAADLKQWEKGTKKRFPETLAAIEKTRDKVENFAPLTAMGLIDRSTTVVEDFAGEAPQGEVQQSAASPAPQVLGASPTAPEVSQEPVALPETHVLAPEGAGADRDDDAAKPVEAVETPEVGSSTDKLVEDDAAKPAEAVETSEVGSFADKLIDDDAAKPVEAVDTPEVASSTDKLVVLQSPAGAAEPKALAADVRDGDLLT